MSNDFDLDTDCDGCCYQCSEKPCIPELIVCPDCDTLQDDEGFCACARMREHARLGTLEEDCVS